MTTWQKGRAIVTRARDEAEGPLPEFIAEIDGHRPPLPRIPGTAIFLNRGSQTAPLAMRANVEHNHVLHEHVIILSLDTKPVPRVDDADRLSVDDLGDRHDGIFFVAAKFGLHGAAQRAPRAAADRPVDHRRAGRRRQRLLLPVQTRTVCRGQTHHGGVAQSDCSSRPRTSPPTRRCISSCRWNAPSSSANGSSSDPEQRGGWRGGMTDSTTCAIVGGGPAGMVLGLLLARAGVEVTVLEKHADFLRDFRGDTVHPSALRLLDDLGLWQKFTALPQSKGRTGRTGPRRHLTDHGGLPPTAPAASLHRDGAAVGSAGPAGRRGQARPTFGLRLEHEVTGLLTEGGRTVGVRYRTPAGEGELRADLTVACDGRTSVVRRAMPAWRRAVSGALRRVVVPAAQGGRRRVLADSAHGAGAAAHHDPREGYFQIAYLIPKGSDAQLRAKGVDAFKSNSPR